MLTGASHRLGSPLGLLLLVAAMSLLATASA
jgi:hypothetical protein